MLNNLSSSSDMINPNVINPNISIYITEVKKIINADFESMILYEFHIIKFIYPKKAYLMQASVEDLELARF